MPVEVVAASIAAVIAAVITALVAKSASRRAERFQVEFSRDLDLSIANKGESSISVDFVPGATMAVDEGPSASRLLRDDNARLRREIIKLNNEFDDRRYRLLREYAAQGLAQSKVSFSVSLAAAVLGFAVIILGVVLSIVSGGVTESVVPVASGAVIDAVALLFFRQDRRTQKTMFDFFERLRQERAIDEALDITDKMPEGATKSRAQALLAMHFAGIGESAELFRILADDERRDS